MIKLTIVVTGTRTNARKGDVTRVLDAMAHGFDEILVGDATGVDAEALDWAKERGCLHKVFVADWYRSDGTIDRGAGPRRNGAMLDYTRHAIVIAFPHPDPKRRNGTDDCIRQAKARGMVVLVCG